ncbi:MAG TPA: PilZ domain-containing protein [Stellaceae bacterium]|nr:PilZ domain-containing protein [Candidatus Sulfotelmatobacter sp.]HVH82631.1 PilZ domain-containing protein [Stellaceae bacterium]
MDGGVALARQTRGQHRHELRTLTYASVEQANGGIVRNLSHSGIGLQVVAAVRAQQQLRVRFELNHPRLRVEAQGEVSWSTRSGQCGIRFIDLSPRTARQIDEWILGNMLEGACVHSERAGFLFPRTASLLQVAEEEDDGLMTSATPVRVIELPRWLDPLQPAQADLASVQKASAASAGLDWLAQPLTGRGLIWTINTLVVVAALLLFGVVFLSITGEPPRWPLAMAGGSAVFVGALYWGFFRLFGGTSPGVRLARMAGWDVEEEQARDTRFR